MTPIFRRYTEFNRDEATTDKLVTIPIFNSQSTQQTWLVLSSIHPLNKRCLYSHRKTSTTIDHIHSGQ
eukprot:1779508-Amphidinium_carterae.3